MLGRFSFNSCNNPNEIVIMIFFIFWMLERAQRDEVTLLARDQLGGTWWSQNSNLDSKAPECSLPLIVQRGSRSLPQRADINKAFKFLNFELYYRAI